MKLRERVPARARAWQPTVVLLVTLEAIAFIACSVSDDMRKDDTGPRGGDPTQVRVVRNSGEPGYSACAVIGAEPLTTIGGPADGAADTPPLFRVRGATVLPNGDIVALNAGTQQLLYFSSDGQYRHAVGRAGAGPGEFRDPTWLGRGAGDTLFVWDDRLQRLSILAGDGEFLRSHQVTGQDADHLPMAVRGRFSDGSFLLVPGPVARMADGDGVTRSPVAYKRYDPASDRVSHLADGLSIETVVGDGVVYVLPFGRREIVLPIDDVLLVTDIGDPSMRSYDLAGRLVRRVEWESDPQPVTARDKREYMARSGKWLPADGVVFASERPRFSSIFVDQRRWVWVREHAAAADGPPDWLVFDQDGRLLCRVAMPSTITVLEVGRDYMLGLHIGSDGEESVVSLPLVVP
ncbi:MAG: hypothetical protein OEY20_03975 [Gemmatimonadota bacterium]|nr:hypothetical protein [Gemmatimonadota bacterium]MDH5196391.1 hypothetical protein [Gemmatimonadota bacterium]